MEKQKNIIFARIIPLTLLFFLCFVAGVSAENSVSPAARKIGPLLKKEIFQTQRNQLLENHGVNESQRIEKDETLIKVIVVMDADYLEPLAESLLRELREKVERFGGRIGNHAFNNVQVWISLGRIEELASWSAIKLIKKPIKPDMHDVMSDSLRDFGAGNWQAGGFTGKGMRVGIIDAGFSGYDDLLGSTLPATVEVKQNGTSADFSSSKHGTACAEIVHALAPDADLLLVNVADLAVDFANAVKWLQSKGVAVISSSIGLNLKIFCQQAYKAMWGSSADLANAGDIVDLIDQVEQQWNATISDAVAHGVTWSQAAGNDARKKWSGPFVDGDQNGYLNFSALDNRNKIDTRGYIDEDVYVLLLWGGVGNQYDDYDLFIVDQYGSVVAESHIEQVRLLLGIEVCKFNVLAGREYFIAIQEYSAPYDYDGNLVLLVGHEQFPTLEYFDPYGTVNLNCPASNPDVITVGAVSLTSSSPEAVIESYSSQGPAGDLLKPDLVAPDGLNTASFSRFYGTSAAAPYVAGICALVKQRYPDFTPVEVKQYLESHALDLGTAGKDNVYGSGLVRLPADFVCRENNLSACESPAGCNEIGAFWFGDRCSLEPRREVCDYNSTIGMAPVRLGAAAADGEISNGEGLALEVDFPLPEETTNYALLSFSGYAYFIRNDNQGNFLTKEFTPVDNGKFFDAPDLCALLRAGYQGKWEIYFLSVPAEADDFKTLEALSDYLESDAGQYVFGQYSLNLNCR
jgi:subtilisin family serine protease